MAGTRYLALGDSITFGFVESTAVPAPDYFRPSSFIAYPEILGADLGLRVANAACTGETSASLINRHAQSNGCENGLSRGDPGYRGRYPLHVRYGGSQLDYALSYLRHHRDVRLVSLMIGVNDYFICAVTTSDACRSTREFSVMTATLRRNVRKILSSIRDQAHYRGQLVIVNYPSRNYSSSIDNAVARVVNQNQDAAARPFRVEIADGYGEFEAATRDTGGDACAAGLLTRVRDGCGEHPSYAGQTLLAQAVKTAIRIG